MEKVGFTLFKHRGNGSSHKLVFRTKVSIKATMSQSGALHNPRNSNLLWPVCPNCIRGYLQQLLTRFVLVCSAISH